jgi:hypothetical protein
MRSLAGLARTGLGLVSFAAARHFDAVGLEGVHSVIYYSGFEGQVRRELIEADMPGPRKGLGTLFGGAPVSWDRLPPLPPDVSRFSAYRLNPTAVYDLLIKAAELANLANPDAAGDSQAEELDRLAGIGLKAELLDYLGDCVVTYHSPAEGAIMFGQVVAVEVKDGAKVLNAMDQIVEARTGANVKLKRRPVRDGEIREIYVRQPGFVFVPSYAVYKNWLVMSFYPQPLQGFIQRLAGDVPAWQPDESVKSAFAALPRQATGLAMSDARPAVQQVLNFAPIIIEASQGFGQGGGFEVGTLPSASVLNRYLTPNVTVQTDDGKTLRWESRGSVLLLGDYLGIDPLALFLLSAIFN